MHGKTVVEDRKLIAARDEYRARWHQKWTEDGLDFALTVPHVLPALENGTSKQATLLSAGYTCIFSLVRLRALNLTEVDGIPSVQLDYTAGVLPVTFVDKIVDALPKDFASTPLGKSMNGVAKGAFSVYDAEKMHGLPLGVQVAGRRLEEEKVLEGMKLIEAALREQGAVFVPRVQM